MIRGGLIQGLEELLPMSKPVEGSSINQLVNNYYIPMSPNANIQVLIYTLRCTKLSVYRVDWWC